MKSFFKNTKKLSIISLLLLLAVSQMNVPSISDGNPSVSIFSSPNPNHIVNVD